MKLRPYQQQAYGATLDYFNGRNLGVLVAPTGAGKSPIMAAIAAHYLSLGLRVLVLAHVKELVLQNAAKLQAFSDENVSVYCAGAGRKEMTGRIVYGSVQSIAANKSFPADFDLIIIDECHRVPMDGEGQYRQILNRMPNAMVLGLTATPYRLGTGYIFGPEKFWNEKIIEIDIAELIKDGYLSDLRTKSHNFVDTKKIKIKGGDFENSALASAFGAVAHKTAHQIMRQGEDRHGWVVFASGVEHAQQLHKAFNDAGISCAIVTGETHSKERDHLVNLFKNKMVRCLVNVGCFTEGFDAPHVDLVALCRATMSAGLYYQMVGRGLRIDPNKKDCLILDFGQNVQRHGPIDAILPIEHKRTKDGDAPVKSCPNCYEVLHLSARECVHCGHTFERELNIDLKPGAEAILSNKKSGLWHNVDAWVFQPHQKLGKPPCIKVTYRCNNFYVTEFLLIEHGGNMTARFDQWWLRLADGSLPPKSVGEFLARQAELQKPEQILAQRNGRYLNVNGYKTKEQINAA